MAAALAAVESGDASAIVVAKLDRLSRSLVDFAFVMARAQVGHWNLVALDLGIDLSTAAGSWAGSNTERAHRIVSYEPYFVWPGG